jgi:hypothetical protein
MSDLVVCAQCNRHVRDASCPFCGASVAGALATAIGRVSRAALFALAAAPGVACHRETVEMYGGPPISVTPEAATTASTTASASASASAASADAPDASIAPSATASHRPATTPPPQTPPRAPVTAYGGPPTKLDPKLQP